MRSMKRQTAATGRSLRNAISRNLKKAERKGSALSRGNLIMPANTTTMIAKNNGNLPFVMAKNAIILPKMMPL